MKQRILMLSLAAALFISLPSCLFAAAHDQCNACHKSHNPPSAENLLTTPQEICVDCHAERITEHEHPVDVPLKKVLKQPLPLVNGEMTCLTCHKHHVSEKDMLRLPADELCKACHDM
jgi:predicted CXXCH cytochrome family protein